MTVSAKKRAQAFRLLSEGVPIPAIASTIGVTTRTIERWKAATMQDSNRSKKTKEEQEYFSRRVPDPLPYDKLSDLGKRMIAPDGFPLFLEQIFGYRLLPWEVKSAKISVDAILDRTQRHYYVANIAPGAGKSSFWTFALPVWLNVGGGFEDPALGRQLRFQLGHASSTISTAYVKRVARLYQSNRVFRDLKRDVDGHYPEGKVVLAQEFGRLKPLESAGDENLWQASQIVVAQIEGGDLSDKDPTFMAVSPGMEYIGARCEYASWDDLVTPQRSRTPDAVAKDSQDFQNIAEQRIEPGGILWLVGQRINSFDLFRDRLNDFYVDQEGVTQQKYTHIVFPAHHEATCPGPDGPHTQWDAEEEGTGCLLDEKRLPWIDLLKHVRDRNFQTLFQQQDSDPAASLVTMPMLEGGTGYETNALTGDVQLVEYPGCFDRDRGWGEFPAHKHSWSDEEHKRSVCDFVSYVTVDPSASGFWSIEWWATRAEEDVRYLIWATRGRYLPGDFLDWDEQNRVFTGWMEKLQRVSRDHNEPIRVWVIEGNNAQRWLMQYNHFHRWKDRWPWVRVIPHQTMKNRNDPEMGVNALLRRKYRTGMASLPRRSGDLRALTYLNAKVKELTTFPAGATDDTVMSDWFGELHIKDILRAGTLRVDEGFVDDPTMPEYVRRQRKTIVVERGRRRMP